MNHKTNKINNQQRSDLVTYVTRLIRDALMVLTSDEQQQVLSKISTGMEVVSSTNTDNLSGPEIEMMITRSIRNQSGKVIAKEIQDPNSAVSISMQKNVQPGRRRI